MWSSSGGLSEGNSNGCNHKITALVSRLTSSSSSSSSSSTSSSPPPPSSSPLSHNLRHHHHHHHQTLIPSGIMEEVWKDITLSSLQPHHHHHSTSSAGPTLRGSSLQDFLGRPSNRDPPTPANINTPSSSLPPHHPLTFLSLNNSVPEFNFLDDSSPFGPSTTRFQSHDRTGMACLSPSPFEALAGSADPGTHGYVTAFGNIKKRVPESEGGTGDRRHKRMIKNRESAARSRARKQEKYFVFMRV